MSNYEFIKDMSEEELADCIFNHDIENMVANYYDIEVSETAEFKEKIIEWLSLDCEES